MAADAPPTADRQGDPRLDRLPRGAHPDAPRVDEPALDALAVSNHQLVGVVTRSDLLKWLEPSAGQTRWPRAV